jgi:signal transduction histidine kinase
MRLTQKFSLALLPVILTVLAASAYLEMRRDVAAFNIDSRRDDLLIGRLFTSTMNDVWNTEGRDRAVTLVSDVLARGSYTHRLRWLDERNLLSLSPASARALREGHEAWQEQHEPAPGILLVYTPLLRDGALAGVLEISEPLANERRYAQRIGFSTFVATICLAAMSLLMTTIVGIWLVARPIRELINKARRVGLGDFTGPLAIGHRDEIGELAAEMNLMSEQLARVNHEINEATMARIVAIDQLRHADRLSTVGKLASGIAHELGTPLNVVSGRAQLILDSIRDNDLNPPESKNVTDVANNARIILEQTERISTIIRQLLDFARRRGANKTECDLQQVVMQSIAMLAALAGKSGITIQVESESAHPSANIDASQIQQVLINILVNAIQSMPGGGKLIVHLRPSNAKPPAGDEVTQSERIEISMHDEGIGIAEDVLPHIFEPFFTTKPLGQSTGLGLSVAYGIVQDHGGFITVESQLGQGTRFAIHLPVR